MADAGIADLGVYRAIRGPWPDQHADKGQWRLDRRVLLWEVALRAQMGVTISFLEEIWSRNLGHVFVSPLRPRELIFALLGVSVARTLIGLAPAVLIAFLLYAFNLFALGRALLLFFLSLLLMGWWMALGVISLLFRYGASAEALAWTLLSGSPRLPACSILFRRFRSGCGQLFRHCLRRIYSEECGQFYTIIS